MSSSSLDLDQHPVCVFAPLDQASVPDRFTPEKVGIYKMRHDGSWWPVAIVDLWGNNHADAGFVPVFKVAILGQRDASR